MFLVATEHDDKIQHRHREPIVVLEFVEGTLTLLLVECDGGNRERNDEGLVGTPLLLSYNGSKRYCRPQQRQSVQKRS